MPAGNITATADISAATESLKKIADFDAGAAEQQAATALIPYLRKFTRVRTGQLSQGWDASDGSFVNAVPWAVPQEFGSKYVDPMNAIENAWVTGEKVVTEVYDAAITKTISEA